MKNVSRFFLNAFLLFTLFLGGLPSTVSAALLDSPTSQWAVDGDIYDIEFDTNGNTYWGGNFYHAGKRTGNVSKLDATTAVLDPNFPEVLNTLNGNPGQISAIVSDGAGGWYIGGEFSHVDGVPLRNIAHINSDLTVDETWNPNITDGQVQTILLDGSTVYAGGTFHLVNGNVTRNLAASFNNTDGTVTAWDPNMGTISQAVSTMAIDNGKIYLGGTFTRANGATVRNRLAAFTLGNSTVSAWNPNVTTGGVTKLLVNSGVLYVVGSFGAVASQSRNDMAAFTTSNDTITGWNPNVTGSITDANFSDHSTLYVVGSFTAIGGNARRNIAEVNLSDALVTAWIPQPTTIVGFNSIVATDDTVYAATNSEFVSTIEGNIRSVGVAFAESDASVTSWNPFVAGGVNNWMIYDSATDSILMGGRHFMANAETRNGFVAINTATDELLTWDPESENSVNAITRDGNTLYVGGYFQEFNGVAQNYLTAIDLTDFSTITFDPLFNNTVNAIEVSDHGTIYVGGMFSTANNPPVSRLYSAEVNKTTGIITSWNPDVDDYVWSIRTGTNNNVYLAGEFYSVQNGTLDRPFLVEVDENTGAPTSWLPDSDAEIYDMEFSGNGTLFVAGDFWEFGSNSTPVAREYLAEISLTTGLPTPWNPIIDDTVYSIELFGSKAYVGGDFENVDGTAQAYLAELDTTTGALSTWRPLMGYTARATGISSTSLYTGRYATRFTGLEVPNTDPQTPATLGPGSYTGGGYTGSNQPSFSFTITDDDDGDTVGYTIQIDDSSDFSSPVVDYTSPTDLTQGEQTFTVGQPAAGGTYTEGEADQELPDGEYYWQIKADDENGGESEYTPANGGDVAFIVDTTPPATPGEPSTDSGESDPTPTITWPGSSDDGSGLDEDETYTVSWCDNPEFTGCSGNTDTTDTNEYTFEEPLPEGTWYVTIEASDDVGNDSETSEVLIITVASSGSGSSGSGSSSGRSSSSGSSSSKSHICTTHHPDGSPSLFEIRVTDTTAQLFFSPQTTVHDYMISYGSLDNAEEHGAWLVGSDSGVNNFTISALNPNQTYYFKVRGQKGCAPGEWSNIMRVSTVRKSGGTRYFYAFMPYVQQVIRSNNIQLPQVTLPAVELEIPALNPSESSTYQQPAQPEAKPAAPPAPAPTKALWWQKLLFWQ